MMALFLIRFRQGDSGWILKGQCAPALALVQFRVLRINTQQSYCCFLNGRIAYSAALFNFGYILGLVHIKPVQTRAKAAGQFIDRYSRSFGHFRRGDIFCSVLPYESNNITAANVGHIGDVKH